MPSRSAHAGSRAEGVLDFARTSSHAPARCPSRHTTPSFGGWRRANERRESDGAAQDEGDEGEQPSDEDDEG